MSNLGDFISGEAELGTESEDGDFDEGTAKTRRKTNGAQRGFDDSSEEDEEDDEEEAARVCEDQSRLDYDIHWIASLTSSRFVPISLLTRMKMRMKIGPEGAERDESGAERKGNKRTSS